MASYRVDHHGTSQRWYESVKGVRTLEAALKIARSIKADGYGVRIIDETMHPEADRVILDAPWQTEVPQLEIGQRVRTNGSMLSPARDGRVADIVVSSANAISFILADGGMFSAEELHAA